MMRDLIPLTPSNFQKGCLFLDVPTNIVYKILQIDIKANLLVFAESDNKFASHFLFDLDLMVKGFIEGVYRFLSFNELQRIWLKKVSPLSVDALLDRMEDVEYNNSQPVLEFLLPNSFPLISRGHTFYPHDTIRIKTAWAKWMPIKAYHNNKSKTQFVLFLDRFDNQTFDYRDFLIFLSESFPFFERPSDEYSYY